MQNQNNLKIAQSTKGRLYVHFRATPSGNHPKHIQVYHGVQFNNIAKIQVNLNNVEKMDFKPAFLTRQKRMRGIHQNHQF